MTTTSNTEDEFYAALGRAVLQWAVVEQDLFKLYGEIMKPQLWVVTSSTYNVVQTFRGKLSLVAVSIKASYPEESYSQLIESWKNLNNKLTNKSSKRNDLVHLSLGTDPNLNLCLKPDPFNAKAMLSETYKSKTYLLEDIKLVETNFLELSRELVSFIENLPLPPLLRREA